MYSSLSLILQLLFPLFFAGAIVDQVLHQLDEVWALCTKGKIHLPVVDIRPLRTLSQSRFTARLPELAGVVDHCLELVRAMSWSQTEFELRRLEGIHMDSSQAISHAESDLTRARERLRSVECQMTRLITYCAQLSAKGVDPVILAEMGHLTTLYRHDIKKAAGTVDQKSALLAECSRAYSTAGERFMETVRYKEFRSRKIDVCLRSIADLVRELLQ